MIDLKKWVVPIAMYLYNSTMVCDKQKARSASRIQARQAETKQQRVTDPEQTERKQSLLDTELWKENLHK